ncbi:oligosaccharide flippase family protein [Deinococcus yavapaiensis]|uniref:O-antigen/teichoic acid export membrane protein n=1 Tax=Deinococcus yavapaiensis KR-236 TaxID=694435 RepID=A0A318SLT5_9DEIO|nr:oligosaccharide flippase family protein [Deinococcus yavapaiensis]PYE55643.1 O-antigen/teichoic acid export membrane protein [Deinococcus yavapaiensis KR-236]
MKLHSLRTAFSRVRGGSLPNILSFLASSILPGLLAIYATSLYSRIFLPAEYGRYSLALAVAAPILVLTSQWLSQSTNRFYHEALNRSEEGRIGEVIAASNFAVILVIGIASLLLFQFGLFKPSDAVYYLSGIAYLITAVLNTNIASFMIYSKRHHLYNATMTAGSFASFVFTLLFLRFTNFGVASILLGTALASICTVALFYAKAGVPLLAPRVNLHSRALLKQFLDYGFPLSLWMLMYTVINISDRYILQYYSGSGEVGLYSIHYSLVSLPLLAINSPIVNIFAPQIMEAAAKLDMDRVKVLISKTTSIYAVIGCFTIGMAILFGNSMPYIIIDRKYHVNVEFYIIILLGFCIWNASMFWHKPLEMKRDTKRMLAFVAIAALINIALNMVFIPRYGMLAAAATTSVAFSVYSALTFFSTRKDVPWRFDGKHLFICVASVLGSIALFKLVPSSLAQAHTILDAVLALCLYVAAFSTIYLVLNRALLVAADKIGRKGAHPRA